MVRMWMESTNDLTFAASSVEVGQEAENAKYQTPTTSIRDRTAQLACHLYAEYRHDGSVDEFFQ
jgi:hypothetical protein